MNSDRHEPFDTNSYGAYEQLIGKDQDVVQESLLQSYIGDWQALQDGTVHNMLLKELAERGIQPRSARPLPPEDPLARYKDIPIHARFLYTSMNLSIEPYILKHYSTIDALARDKCDIYWSLEQFDKPGESLDFLENSYILKRSGVQIGYDELPGIFFWDQACEGEFISFGPDAREPDLNAILPCVFQKIREEPTIAAVRRAKKILRL